VGRAPDFPNTDALHAGSHLRLPDRRAQRPYSGDDRHRPFPARHFFVVGHFHATIFGGFVFPFFAAVCFWYPKITGRMYDETMGKLHFWLMTPVSG
jgi:hypothetical protein